MYNLTKSFIIDSLIKTLSKILRLSEHNVYNLLTLIDLTCDSI